MLVAVVAAAAAPASRGRVGGGGWPRARPEARPSSSGAAGQPAACWRWRLAEGTAGSTAGSTAGGGSQTVSGQSRAFPPSNGVSESRHAHIPCMLPMSPKCTWGMGPPADWGRFGCRFNRHPASIVPPPMHIGHAPLPSPPRPASAGQTEGGQASAGGTLGGWALRADRTMCPSAVRSQLRVTTLQLPAVGRSGCCGWGRAFPEDGNAKDGSAKCQGGTEAPRTCRAQNGQRRGRKRRGWQRHGECMVSAERRSAWHNEHPTAQHSTASADRMASSGMTKAE